MKKLLITLASMTLLLSGCAGGGNSSEVSSTPASSTVSSITSSIVCSHDYELVSTDAATCETPVVKHLKCKKCEATKDEKEGEALGHLVSGDDYLHFHDCERPGCGKRARKPSGKTFLETFKPTYTAEMKEKVLAGIATVNEEIAKYKDETDPSKLEAGSEAVNALFEKAEEKFVELIDEYYVAETYDMIDHSNYSSLLKDVDAAYNECYNKYMNILYNGFYSPLKTYLFSPEDIEELAKYIDAFGDEQIKALKDEITALEDTLSSNLSATKLATNIFELKEKRNELAKKLKYNSHYEYASDIDFNREYTMEQLSTFKGYLKQYICPTVTALYSKFNNGTDAKALGKEMETMAKKYNDTNAFNNEDSLESLLGYFDTMKSTTYGLDFTTSLNNAFKDGRIFTPSSGQAGAFTQKREKDGPFMYFSSKSYYSCPSTLAHEFGHFTYNYLDNDDKCGSYDFKETHSQTDEILYQRYYIDNDFTMYTADKIKEYEQYMLLDNLLTAIITAAIDEWEHAVYTNYYDAKGYRDGIDKSKYENLWYIISEDYKLPANYTFANCINYFKDSSCYEISYSISLMPVTALYSEIPTIGFEGAKEKYYKLLTYANDPTYEGEHTFTDILNFCGFSSPFEQQTYIDILSYYID